MRSVAGAGWSRPPWRRSATPPLPALLLPVAGCLLLFTLSRLVRAAGWDEAFYLAQLASVVGDRDLVLHDDLAALPNELPLRLRTVALTDGSGALRNAFSIGPAWLHASYAWPLVTSAQDFGPPLRAVLSLGSMLLLVLTFLLTRTLLTQFGAGAGLAAACSAGAVLWGPLALYGTRAHASAHLPSAFWAALLLVAFLRWRASDAHRHALIGGIAAGALAITRWQDFVLVALLAAAGAVHASRVHARRRRRVVALLAAVAAAALLGLVQLLAFQRQFGTWLEPPQGPGFMRWQAPALAPVLWSPLHGLFTWTPFFGAGLLGLVVCARSRPRHKLELAALAAAVILSVYVSAAAHDWWAGSAFGPRRLSALTPLAALGLWFVAARLSAAQRVVAAVVASAWAVLVLSAFFSGYEDLHTVVAGQPSSAAAAAGLAREWTGWRDAWGPLHALKPGFTLSDAPGNADRLLGLAVVGGVCAAGALLWRAGRTRAGQRLFAVGGLAWAAAWCVVVARAPDNGSTNAAWHRVLAGQATLSEPSPPLRAAAELLAAVCALERGDAAGAAAALGRAEALGAAPVPARAAHDLLRDSELTAWALGGRPVRQVCGRSTLAP